MGAAMLESEEFRKRSFKRIHQLRQHEAARKNFACTDPLSMKNVLLLRNRTGEKVSGARCEQTGAGAWGWGWGRVIAFMVSGLGSTGARGACISRPAVRCQTKTKLGSFCFS